MSRKHLSRLKSMSPFAVPEPGTAEEKAFQEWMEQHPPSPEQKPYLEKIDEERVAVPAAEESSLWRTIGIARFDFEDRTQDGHYVLQDVGDMFRIFTDDLMMPATADFGEREAASVRAMFERLREFTAVFDLCAAALRLPQCADAMEEQITLERHETSYRDEVKNAPEAVKRWIPASEKIAYRTVHVIPVGLSLNIPQRTFSPPPNLGSKYRDIGSNSTPQALLAKTSMVARYMAVLGFPSDWRGSRRTRARCCTRGKGRSRARQDQIPDGFTFYAALSTHPTCLRSA